MDASDTNRCFLLDDDLLNFELDGEEHKPDTHNLKKDRYFSPLESPNKTRLHELEEELEWLDNKDSFPTLESCLDILSDNPSIELDHQSPVSVLENSSSISNNSENSGNGEEKGNGITIMTFCGSLHVPRKFPVGKRSKGRRGRTLFPDLTTKQNMLLNHVNGKARKEIWAMELPPITVNANKSSSIGRRCLHCQADKTPQWRAGPMGPKTLCNACGVRFKSGRLVPEYRPANSPTFSPSAHSNSHRKIMEMRRQKVGNDGLNQGCGYNRVG